MLLDVLLDTFIDLIKLVPFLFLAFFLIELIEHKFSDKSKSIIEKSGKYGPILGSILGIVPQCGFSVMATNLYITRIITLGTLVAVYLSTSDEMLPILLTEKASVDIIIKILLTKIIIGILCGFVIDFIVRRKTKTTKTAFDICEKDHCHCEKGLLHSTIVHTSKSLFFIAIVTFFLNLLMEYIGLEAINKIFMKDTLYAPIFSSLVGLIPNCGASIILTELYLKGALSYAALIAGVLTNSGIALIVLFKSNKSLKEKLSILALIYFIGLISGIIIEFINLF